MSRGGLVRVTFLNIFSLYGSWYKYKPSLEQKSHKKWVSIKSMNIITQLCFSINLDCSVRTELFPLQLKARSRNNVAEEGFYLFQIDVLSAPLVDKLFRPYYSTFFKATKL